MADTPNRLQRALAPIARLPAFLQGPARTLAVGRAVPFVGTAGVQVLSLEADRVVMRLEPRKRVQNHIQGMHAAATALLGETATGFAFGMHVRDDALPLLKSMHLDYRKVVTGGIRAEAWLDPADLARVREEPRGDVQVHLSLTDDAGVAPVDCAFVWAWVPRERRD